MPKENSFETFHSGQYQFKVPLAICSDFEVILQEEEETELYGSSIPEDPYAKRINGDIPSRFCTYSTFAYGKVKDWLRLDRGKDCIEVFCKHIESETRRLYNMFPEMSMKHLTQEEWREFTRAMKCHICFKEFKEDDIMVRDHCYYMGLYQGPANRIGIKLLGTSQLFPHPKWLQHTSVY